MIIEILARKILVEELSDQRDEPLESRKRAWCHPQGTFMGGGEEP